MVGEKESWSSNKNKSSCSKQWTNISTNDSINNQNLQCKIISNPLIDVESQQPIFPYKAKTKPSALHFQLYIILNRSTHIYIFGLFDIQMHSWYLFVFTYRVYLLFNQFKYKCRWYSFQNPLLRCFHWSMTTVIFPTIWLS